MSQKTQNVEIRIKEKLTGSNTTWFEELDLVDLPEDGCLIKGLVNDQAALFGILNRVRDLNLNLVSVQVFTSTDQD